MGSFAFVNVNGYQLIDSKSSVIPELAATFQESDRRTRQEAYDPTEPDDVQTVVEYVCTAKQMIDRLNVIGFTIQRVRSDYEDNRRADLDRYDEEDWQPEDYELKKSLTFENYSQHFEAIIRRRFVGYVDDREALDDTTRYLLKNHDDYLYGFYCSDLRSLLRLACEVAPPEAAVSYDVTELVGAGYYEEDTAVCAEAARELIARHPENASSIILPEGSTDAFVLKEGLSLLYPHLVGYYSFLDFESSGWHGGTGQLSGLVKAFAGAGITNRTIALFDNDTGAREAAKSLSSLALPPTMVVLHYPEVPLLKAYPTIGPSGTVHMDVNGLAGSIEMYFGRDILNDEEGHLTPVHWRGYSAGMQCYQGEVMYKAKLLERFKRRAARCRLDATELARTDWTGIDAILERIFRAFD